MKTSISVINKIKVRIIQRLDVFLNWLYSYRGKYESPRIKDLLIWSLPPTNLSFSQSSSLPNEKLQPEEYFQHYFQSQGYGPTKNECVTTSVVMSMNMMKDRVALSQGPSANVIPDRLLESYTRELDSLGVYGWRYRFSTNSWLPGMMTPWQAVLALKNFAYLINIQHGKKYKVKLSSGHNVNNLVEYLMDRRIILIHGARRMTLLPNAENYDPLLPWLGGMPHTMMLVGYDGPADQWILLNPAKPWLTNRNNSELKKLFRMTTKELLDYWGRQFLFYPPRFSVTVITLPT